MEPALIWLGCAQLIEGLRSENWILHVTNQSARQSSSFLTSNASRCLGNLPLQSIVGALSVLFLDCEQSLREVTVS